MVPYLYVVPGRRGRAGEKGKGLDMPEGRVTEKERTTCRLSGHVGERLAMLTGAVLLCCGMVVLCSDWPFGGTARAEESRQESSRQGAARAGTAASSPAAGTTRTVTDPRFLDPDPRRRAAAVRRAALEGDAKIVADLEILLGDPSPLVRQAAAEALAMVGGPPQGPLLIRALTDRVGGVRKASAYALGTLGITNAVPALVKILGDAQGPVRRAAVEALGALGAAEACAPVTSLASDRAPMVRLAVLHAMRDMHCPNRMDIAVDLLGDHVWQVRRAAAKELVHLGPAAAPVAAKALSHTYWLVRAQAAEVLGRLKADGYVPALVAVLGDPSSHVRYAAAMALGRIGDRAGGDSVTRLLSDDDPFVREAAAQACAHICGSMAVRPLLHLLSDPGAMLRMAAAQALGRIGDRAAVAGLMKAAEDSKPYVRQAAVDALGRLGDARALAVLASRVGDKDRMVRSVAAQALARIGVLALPTLAGLAESGNPSIRQAALSAVGKIPDAQSGEIVAKALSDLDWSVRASAADAARRLGTVALPALIASAGKGTAAGRAAVARALGEIGDLRAVATLVQLLGDGSVEVVIQAAWALGKIGSPSTAPALLKRLHHENWRVRREVVRSLAVLACPDCIQALRDAARDRDSRVAVVAKTLLPKALARARQSRPTDAAGGQPGSSEQSAPHSEPNSGSGTKGPAPASSVEATSPASTTKSE